MFEQKTIAFVYQEHTFEVQTPVTNRDMIDYSTKYAGTGRVSLIHYLFQQKVKIDSRAPTVEEIEQMPYQLSQKILVFMEYDMDKTDEQVQDIHFL